MARRHQWSVAKAKPVTIDGVRFASQREAARWHELRLLEQAGEIRGLERQPAFPIVINGQPVRALRKKNGALGSPLTYHADAAYFRGERRIVEDTKGHDDPTSRLRRALVEHIYNVTVELVR